MNGDAHLVAAELLAVRDEGTGCLEAERAAHLQACDRCRQALDETRSRARRIEAALPRGRELDRAAMEEARARIRTRLTSTRRPAPADTASGTKGRQGPDHPGHRWGLASLARAAGLVLLLAGGAAALPGSPVRHWIVSAFEDPAPAAEAVEAVPIADAAGPAETGVRLRVSGGPVEVAVTGAGAGTRIEVRQDEGAELAVFAPEGSRFRSAEGRVEVVASGGPVRVRLPSGAFPAILRVDGVVYLRWTRDGPTILGPVIEREDGRIVFDVGG